MGVAPSGVLGIELGQFLLGFALDPLAPFADFIGEALAIFGDVFEDDLVEQHRHGIEVAGKGVRAHAQGFERNGAAAGKWVHDERPGAGSPPSASCAAWVSARLVSRYSRTVELSQLAKSAMKSSSASGADQVVSILRVSSCARRARTASRWSREKCLRSRDCSQGQRGFGRVLLGNVGGQSSSAGSGQSAAQITARHAASGRRAHQMCSVEICPCRIDFSRRAWAEMRVIGRSTSMRRLG